MKWRCILISFLTFSLYVHAQEYPRNNMDIQKLTDELLAQQDLALNYEELYENLLQILSNPISLNRATAEEFRFLNILSEPQLQSLLRYREMQGPFSSVYELQSIEQFDLATIRKFAPFVTIQTNGSNTKIMDRILTTQNTYLILRYDYTFQEKAGYTIAVDSANKFLGSRGRVYSRFRSSKPGDYSVGFTVEKDAGESIMWNAKQKYYGFDYSSFHFQIQNRGFIKNLIVGDFQGQFGQGLLLGGFFGFGKGAESITTTRRSTIGFLPYTSVDETSMLRGAAVTLQLNKHLDFSTYYSQKGKDALVINTVEDDVISSFQTTGLHRNEKELSTRNQIKESNYGIVINTDTRRFKGGVILNGTSFENPVKKAPTVYNQFTFSGTHAINLSVYSSYSIQNFNVFGELAKTHNNGWGGVVGMLGSLSKELDISILFRKYDPNFYSFYSNAFGESSIPQNESGIYWGLKYTFNKRISVAGYLDLFNFKWLRYRSYAPSNGHEWLFRFNYSPSKTSLLYFQYREEQKDQNIGSDGNLYLIAKGMKRNVLINFNYELTKTLQMKTRLQASSYNFNNLFTSGVALIQDLQWKLNRFEIVGRYALFQTDNYENRQYTYERDTYLAYSFPAYYGKGLRFYLMLEYEASQHVRIWARLGHTRFLNQESIGSGLDTIQGNQREDIRIQILIRP